MWSRSLDSEDGFAPIYDSAAVGGRRASQQQKPHMCAPPPVTRSFTVFEICKRVGLDFVERKEKCFFCVTKDYYCTRPYKDRSDDGWEARGSERAGSFFFFLLFTFLKPIPSTYADLGRERALQSGLRLA